MSFPALARDAHFDKEKALDLLKKVNLGQYDLNSKIEHLSEVNVKGLRLHVNLCIVRIYYC